MQQAITARTNAGLANHHGRKLTIGTVAEDDIAAARLSRFNLWQTIRDHVAKVFEPGILDDARGPDLSFIAAANILGRITARHSKNAVRGEQDAIMLPELVWCLRMTNSF